MGPFLLQDGNKNKVQLVEEGALVSEALFRAGGLNDEVDNEVADTCTSSEKPKSGHKPRYSYLGIGPWEELSTSS